MTASTSFSTDSLPASSLAFPEFFPFTRPFLDEQTIADVGDCLRSGWITTGPRVQAFEAALSAYHQAPHVICVASATIGLQIALVALDIQPGDEVITTSLTFVATINSILHAGATPVLVDIDPETLNIDLAAVEAAITPRTKAIMPVHFAGLPVDLDGFYALAQRHNITIIEDAAHASGAFYKGRPIGAMGDIQVLSFHPNKNMTTGEGGAILLRDADLAAKIRQLAFHGIDRNAWNRFGKTGTQNYDVVLPGFKANMMDIQAAMGLRQLEKLDACVAIRKMLAETYMTALADNPYLRMVSLPSYEHTHGWHLMTVQVTDTAPLTRDELMAHLKERNVGTGLHYQACHQHSYIAEKVKMDPAALGQSARVGAQILSLPLHPQMTKDDVHKVVRIINDVFNIAMEKAST